MSLQQIPARDTDDRWFNAVYVVVLIVATGIAAIAFGGL